MDDSFPGPPRIRQYLRSEHVEVLESIEACADTVASDPGKPIAAGRESIVEPFRAALETKGVLSELPAVLVDVVDRAGHEMPAAPAPAPPYVVVTSTGVLLRVTLPPGRLVIAIEPFAVSRGEPPSYRRRSELGLDVRLE